MAETSGSSFCFVKRFHLFPSHAGIRRDYHLADALAVVDGEGFVGVVDHYHADFAAVVGIDRAGGVHQRYAVFDCQSF